jgi:hypothetical protein
MNGDDAPRVARLLASTGTGWRVPTRQVNLTSWLAATTSAFSVLAVTATQTSAHGASAGVARSCGTEHIYRITGTIQASGISCSKAHSVFRAVERAPLPSDVASTPYFHYSRTYRVHTPYGRFACRREPHGLGGSEHNIRCQRGESRVSWDTRHD